MTKKITPQTLKGFRDFLPEEAIKRQYLEDKIRKVFELYGYDPLETPALEYAETLLGKYGKEADKLLYLFKDKGGRQVGLRYDPTVPLSRIIAQYPNLPTPFKRYQIGPMWRAEKPQSGRFREFTQCDFDVVGTSTVLADAEIAAVIVKTLNSLGIKNFYLIYNDRNLVSWRLSQAGVKKPDRIPVMRILDKEEKIGKKGIEKELINFGLEVKQVKLIFDKLSFTKSLLEQLDDAKKYFVEEKGFRDISEEELKIKNTLNRLTMFLKYISILKIDETCQWNPFLMRGLDYYTGIIFEAKIKGYKGGSVGGGGRYDKLISMFTGIDRPAVGFSFGLDRLIEAMDQQKLFKDFYPTSTQILVTIFSPDYLEKSIEVATTLRFSNLVNTELYPDPDVKLDKQLKYADKKGIPWVIIIGPEEVEKNKVTIKNMTSGEQKRVEAEEIGKIIK